MATSTLQWIGQGLASISLALLSPLVVGIVLFGVTYYFEKKRVKSEAIRDLMTYRGDFASPDFRRSLNRVSVIFHDQENIRTEVRHLYEVINDASSNAEQTKRAIVGLIYKLCQQNGFKGLSEYDIDQAFPENRQIPQASLDAPAVTPATPAAHTAESTPKTPRV